jgi:dipeptidase E
MKLLLICNSSNYGKSYLEHCKSGIRELIGRDKSDFIFIPYAAMTISRDDDEGKVNNVLSEFGLCVKSIHHFKDPESAIDSARCILVGGENTFHLLAYLYQYKLIQKIREKVISGVLYIGWSAGINIVCSDISPIALSRSVPDKSALY